MEILYVLCVWLHIGTIIFWIGAMFFEDPESDRFFSRLVDRMGGVGWYAQAIVWPTGVIMLNHRGVTLEELFTRDFISTTWGQMLWFKLALVLTLAGFQLAVGHKASKLIYGYVLIALIIVGISVILVRPALIQ